MEIFSRYRWRINALTDSCFHHTAAFDMRSSVTENGHGHQACYDEIGNLIESGVSAGSADFSAAPSWNNWSIDHVDNDVLPFMWALHMDGNPLKRTGTLGIILNKLTSPIIYQGQNLEKYLNRRPPHTYEQLNPE
jgi:hypothetical protein